MTDQFLPSDYAPPKKDSLYLKLTVGTHRVRFLDSPITGQEGWKNKKPIRKRDGEPWHPDEVDDANKIKHFWSAPVWDYSGALKILQINQATIQRAINDLSKDPDWGHPKGYDIAITRTGTDKENTEYSVVPKPKCAPPESALIAYREACMKGFDLKRLYRGTDPFTPDEGEDFQPNKDVPF